MKQKGLGDIIAKPFLQIGSSGLIRTGDQPVNSRLLYR
jgi:hypothetical protein